MSSSCSGVADVSRRYAYDLVDNMIREFPWAHAPDDVAAHVEQDTRQKGVLIDFEGVHGEAVAVNKFTTRIERVNHARTTPRLRLDYVSTNVHYSNHTLLTTTTTTKV